MGQPKKYDLDPETLLYQISEEPLRDRLMRTGIIMLISMGLTVLYFWIYTSVLGFDAPKLALLKSQNERLASDIAMMNLRMNRYEEALDALEMRNENVYRSIFGMNPIPDDILGRSDEKGDNNILLEKVGRTSPLRVTYNRLDKLMKRTYVGSKSYDEVASLSKRAGDMASCIPAIPPIDPDPKKFHVSSGFGGRTDPVYGGYRMHSGVDFSAKKGTPVYATGDGVIATVKFQFYGYGTVVSIDHGFGYQTTYAHLSEVYVVEGMKIKRGDCIASVGSSGKSTGPHLHYEVCYRQKKVNPANFYDLTMTSAEYSAMVKKRDSESPAILRPEFRVRKR